MDKIITTALLIAISMITAMLLFNAAYPAVMEGGEAITSMASNTTNRMRNRIAIVHASGELDHTGWWHDSNSNGLFEVFGWVKNIGLARITTTDFIDVFFGREGNFTRIPNEAAAGGVRPYWTASIEGGGEWVPATTLSIAVHYSDPLTNGQYYLKIVLQDGTSSDYYLGM
jgi:hypothetical protein